MIQCGVFWPLCPRCSTAATVCLQGEAGIRHREGEFEPSLDSQRTPRAALPEAAPLSFVVSPGGARLHGCAAPGATSSA